MHVFYASHDFSHRVVCPLAILKRFFDPQKLPIFYVLNFINLSQYHFRIWACTPSGVSSPQGDCRALPGVLPCTVVWKLTPGRAPGNRSIWESVALLGQLQLSASFPGSCANLQSHGLCMRVLVIPEASQDWLHLSLILFILVGMVLNLYFPDD